MEVWGRSCAFNWFPLALRDDCCAIPQGEGVLFYAAKILKAKMIHISISTMQPAR